MYKELTQCPPKKVWGIMDRKINGKKEIVSAHQTVLIIIERYGFSFRYLKKANIKKKKLINKPIEKEVATT
ncbi:hypothetical protein [Paenibacillus sp. FSL H7-0331]|uniref:hypothetical protein n=1 Tax=Paenibacillus sp. FSL H7-0331 TaxID=1920421 RepID=UPI0015C3D222|nr:hypothetical protein [Paenibacillus sp. FSL H7-0331]